MLGTTPTSRVFFIFARTTPLDPTSECDPTAMHCRASHNVVSRWDQACDAPDGAVWARSGHTVVSVWDRFLLFGGSIDTADGSLTLADDVWQCSPITRQSTRLQCSGAGPRGRFGHSATVVSRGPGSSAVMVVHGGKVQSGPNHAPDNTTFVLELRNDKPHWRKAEVLNGPGSPVPRWGHSAVYIGDVPTSAAWSSVRNRDIKSGILVFGGDCGGMMNDLMFLDVATETWLPLQVRCKDKPLARRNHTACTSGQHMYVFGGRGGTEDFLQDLWSLDLNSLTWQQLQPRGSIPAARTGHTAVLCLDKMIVFGGFCGTPHVRTFFADVHAYDICTQEWAVVNTTSCPTDPMSHACATPCALPDRLIVTPSEQPPLLPAAPPCCSRPSPRTMSCSVLHDSGMYVFGGRDNWAAPAGAFRLQLRTAAPRLMDLVMQWVVDHRLNDIYEDIPDLIRQKMDHVLVSQCMLCTRRCGTP